MNAGMKALLTENLKSLKLSTMIRDLPGHLRQAQQALSEITGEFTSDDLLGEIFGSFCIGK